MLQHSVTIAEVSSNAAAPDSPSASRHHCDAPTPRTAQKITSKASEAAVAVHVRQLHDHKTGPEQPVSSAAAATNQDLLEPGAIVIVTDGGSHAGASSVYELLTKRKRNAVLLAAAVASILVPLTDTIYLPALQAVGRDLRADAGLVAASVAIYMLTVGIGSLFWGPMVRRC
eukprot:GHRQ01015842.1.p1 GENE.GHRQ01015842.1~~GHRQ01015842.1.p1  ORF type:complete len:172 (+),score=49.83 GHRQ01015842.1:307-822(+)